MFELYVTVLAVFFVVRGFFHWLYLHDESKIKRLSKRRRVNLIKWFGSNNSFYRLGFWLSLLWLIVYYFKCVFDV